MFDHLTAGIEEICGHRGNNFFRVISLSFSLFLRAPNIWVVAMVMQEKIEHIDERYLRPIFTRSTDKNSLQRLFEKLTLRYENTKRDAYCILICVFFGSLTENMRRTCTTGRVNIRTSLPCPVTPK